MKKIKSILAVAVLSSGYCFSQTAIYSNSLTGSDATGDGSSANPYRSFYAAYTGASNGDTLVLNGTFDWGNSGELGDAAITGFTLTKALVIIGQGVGSTFIQAASTAGTADRSVFTIDQDVEFKNLTIRYGKNSNQAHSSGGITVMDNTRNNRVVIDRCSIEYNEVDNGTTTNYYFAGGIYLRGNTSYHPNLVVTNSTFHNNSANGKAYGAGALYSMQSNNITVENSTFNNNSGTDGSNFGVGYHNVAGAAGFFRFNNVVFTNCTFAHNTSETSGAAILTWYNYTYLTNNTIAYNNVTSASGKGAGLYAVFFQQSPGQLFLKNNIIANNYVNGLSADVDFNTDSWASSIHDNGNNIIEAYTGSSITLNGTGTITGEQSLLNLSTTLADNSTSTNSFTLELTSGSIAINAGDNNSNGSVTVPTLDQRGLLRSGSTDIGAFEFGGTGLPVTLTTFAADCVSDGVELKWQTISEKNSSHFVVERSSDMNNWVYVGELNAAGNSTDEINYELKDERKQNGTAYYRLVQYDKDGVSESFGPISSNCTTELPMTVAPNPTADVTYVRVEVPSTAEYKLRLVDVNGLVIEERKLQLPKGNNAILLDASALTAGVYFVELSGTNKRVKLLKN